MRHWIGFLAGIEAMTAFGAEERLPNADTTDDPDDEYWPDDEAGVTKDSNLPETTDDKSLKNKK